MFTDIKRIPERVRKHFTKQVNIYKHDIHMTQIEVVVYTNNFKKHNCHPTQCVKDTNIFKTLIISVLSRKDIKANSTHKLSQKFQNKSRFTCTSFCVDELNSFNGKISLESV